MTPPERFFAAMKAYREVEFTIQDEGGPLDTEWERRRIELLSAKDAWDGWREWVDAISALRW